MALIVIDPPNTEPLTLAESKLMPYVENASTDTLLGFLITAAREEAEAITRRALITQTLEIVLDGFPAGRGGIDLYCPPIQSVTSIKYIDTDGVEQTLSSDLYDLDTENEPGLVAPAEDESWPSTRDQINAVRVRYVAGYGVAEAVPTKIKLWMMRWIATHYEHRENIVVGQPVAPLPSPFVDGLLNEYRVYSFR